MATARMFRNNKTLITISNLKNISNKQISNLKANEEMAKLLTTINTICLPMASILQLQLIKFNFININGFKTLNIISEQGGKGKVDVELKNPEANSLKQFINKESKLEIIINDQKPSTIDLTSDNIILDLSNFLKNELKLEGAFLVFFQFNSKKLTDYSASIIIIPEDKTPKQATLNYIADFAQEVSQNSQAVFRLTEDAELISKINILV
jgi:hypothetical protein